MPPKLTLNESRVHQAGRLRVEVTAEPIVHDFDARALGEGPARAIADAIRAGIRVIATAAAPATLRRRRAEGVTTTGLFNATGHLARDLTAAWRGDEWAIDAPADRLVAGAGRDADALARMLERLAELVPVLHDPIAAPGVRAAIEATLARLIQRGKSP